MNRMFVIARRVLTQIRHDKRLFGLSIVAPFVIIYFFKIFFDPMPALFDKSRYVVPIAAYMVHFLAFILCALVLVQERTAGTLQRMFINGFTRIEIVGGYVLGYTVLATIQSIIVLAEVLWLFDLDYDWNVLAILFVIMWLLAVTSIMLGIFVSTFARHEGQVLPFIPLFMLPSIFLSGMIMNVADLPTWTQWLGRIFPLRYANDAIQEIIKTTSDSGVIWRNVAILVLYGGVVLLVASRTLREVE